MALKKELGLLDVFCISSGAMISSGLFILPALAYANTGSAVIISYMLAGLLILPTVMSKAELTTAMPKTGGIFFFTDRSMGPVAGTIGGFSAWLSLSFKSAFALLGMGIFLLLFKAALTDFQIQLVAAGLCLFFMTLNIVGVKLASKVQVILVIALISLLALYIAAGLFFVKPGNFTPFLKDGATWTAIPATAGLVFISYAGTTKTAAVAGEVKNPGRNLPLGMLLAWGVSTFLYLCVITVTIGILDHDVLSNTLTPISSGGDVIFPVVGLVLMSAAGLMAFITTANGGIMAASRDPMAMGTDGLLPKFFSKTSKKFGTPWVSIVITVGVMIAIIFLPLETFVKTASTLKLILFMMANVAVIFMREANIPHYRPKFRSPFYPFIQIAAVLAYGYLLVQMDIIPLISSSPGSHEWNKAAIVVGFTLIFLVLCVGWYFIYVRGKVKRQSAMFLVVERLMKTKSTNLLDGELRSILAERDEINEDRLGKVLDDSIVLDLDYFMAPGEFSEVVSKELAKPLKIGQKDLYNRLVNREKSSNMLLGKGMAIISFHIRGKNKFKTAIVRTKRGAMFTDSKEPVHAAFIVVSSPDEKAFYLNTLMWLVQTGERIDFKKEWMKAKGKKGLKKLVMKRYRECCGSAFWKE